MDGCGLEELASVREDRAGVPVQPSAAGAGATLGFVGSGVEPVRDGRAHAPVQAASGGTGAILRVVGSEAVELPPVLE